MNKADMKVSIITPYYNGSKFLEDAVKSVLEQSYSNFEMLIVNDASPDNPQCLLEKIENSDDRIKVFHHKENQGIAAARNTAIRNSTGDVFALIDQDDMWLPEKLQLQINEFNINAEVGLVFSNYFRTDEFGKITGQGNKCKQIVVESDEKTLINLFSKNRITACSVMFRRECIDTVGLFNESLRGGTDDYDMWLKIAGRYKLKYIDMPLVKRRAHGDNTSGLFKERGMLDHLHIVEDICRLYPLLNKYRAQRLSKICYHLGRYYKRCGNKSEARIYFKKMMEFTPFKLEPYLGILKTFL